MPTINLSVTVPSDVVDAVTAWRLNNTVDDGQGGQTPKYADNVALLRGIIKDAVVRILDQQPTAGIQAQLDAIEVARATIQTAKDGSVT